MSVIPCQQSEKLRRQIVEVAETLRTHSHTLGEHGIDEREFYDSGVFRGAVERLRGQYAASMREKRELAKHVLNHMEDRKFIVNWEPAGDANRHDYRVQLMSGRTAIIELKGCLDGNNTNIFDRPPHAHEFIIWSVCTNPGADPRHNAWSGIHTRLSAEIISRRSDRRRHRHLGHGLRHHRPTVPKTTRRSISHDSCRPFLAAAAMLVRAAGDDPEPTQQPEPTATGACRRSDHASVQ